jgi:hypothetical protein
MSADRDANRIVRSWLREDRHEDADRVLNAVLDQLDATPQRHARSWLARRHPSMNAYLRAGAAAAALLFAALIGISVFGGGPNVVSPGPTATPSPSISPSPSLQAWIGSLQPGRRNEAMLQGVRFSFRIPSEGGWVTTQYNGMIRGALLPERWIGFLNTVDSVASDPCTGAARAVGPSVADLAEALTTIPGTESESPTDATVGGLPAKLVTFTINDDIGCAPSSFWIYGRNSAYPNGIDSTIKVWVFELDGKRYTIHSDQEDLDSAGTQEIADIVDSIQFE